MTERLEQLAEDRAARNAARENFHANLRNIASDLEARGIGERIADRTWREARELADKTLVVASESKGVIAGTVAALLLWVFRTPLLAWFSDLLGEDDSDAEPVQVEDSDAER